MAEVSITHVILFIAAISLSTIVGGTATNIAGDVGHAIEDIGSDYADQVSQSVTVISDPGATLYDAETNTLTLLAKNTGELRLPTDRDSLLVLVDGEPVTVTNVTVVDGSYWRPGYVARIQANTSLDGGAHRVVVTAAESRDFFSFPYRGGGGTGLADGIVVYAGDASLNSIRYDEASVTTHRSNEPQVVGSATVDFDGDGTFGVPYVQNDTLHLVDGTDAPQTLPGDPPSSESHLATGSWNGSGPSVFYVGPNKDLRRTGPDATSGTLVAEVSSTQGAGSVLGVADYDGDGTRDIIYLGSSGGLYYVSPDETPASVGVSAANTYAAGQPTEFYGDGTVYVPYIGGSGYVHLADSDNNKRQLTTETKASNTGLSVDDVDRDGEPEVVFVDSSSSTSLRYVNADGTTGYVHDADGQRIPVNKGVGIA
ncbi:archaellum component FlaG (FlaF/FlaG flagellin family) [Halarchaeum rubridurum]|uniref:Archaellum component FlaG (FlaF/FlaG flagellin family) n=1 Tax=Halarchaeum rubridurum TaxID=489911 RepID=A0A830G1F2_9EURY|nr:hypothetical protein [Halarchaeum rubridurum]MBP1954908.1 archaellum component FlaG (FlaF/FlaG flagellin family) [Halarchaeum rubridurum]GGM70433.1 hypothetical protein GCM10009017_20820 [Halarchaeum rubridurum]